MKEVIIMKKSNNAKTRKIAAALAALSIASAMALPISSVTASAAESSEIVYELPEIDTNPAVIQKTDEAVYDDRDTRNASGGEIVRIKEKRDARGVYDAPDRDEKILFYAFLNCAFHNDSAKK